MPVFCVFLQKIRGASHNFFNFIYIYKIEIRNSEIYLPEVSVSSTMVRVVPDFLGNSFDGAGCLLDLDPSPVMGRVDFLKVDQVHSRLINKKKSKLPQFTSVAADFLVSQPSLGGTGPTSVSSKLHDLAVSVSNNAINGSCQIT